jgi:tetratricopeptide (TPR) repeat protein
MQNPKHATAALWVLTGLLLVAPSALADLDKADALRAEKKHAEAVAEYKKVLEAEPENLAALYGIGFSLTEIGKTEQFSDSLWAARQKLEKLVLLEPGNPEYRYLNAYSAIFLAPRAPSFTRVLRERAVKELNASLKARPQHWESWYWLGKVLGDSARRQQAVEAFEKAIALTPDRLEPYPDLALAQYALGRHDDCILTAKLLLDKSSTYHYAHKIIGDAHAAKGEFAAAEAAYLRGNEKQPGQATWADGLFLLFQRMKDPDRAVTVFTALVESSPNAEAPRKFLALNLAGLSRHAEAAAHFRILTEKFPAVPWYFMGLAEAEEKTGNDEAAVEGYLNALRLKPDWPNPFLPLRERYTRAKKAGRFAEAAALLRRISACKPYARTHAWIVWELSECLKETGDVEGTIAALQKAMELDPIEPRFHNSLGLYFRVLKRFDDAVIEFEKALELEPGYMYTLENLAATNQQAHREAEARKWMEEGLSNAQEQYAWAGDTEVKSEREFDIFKFSYFLHEVETLEDRKEEPGKK